MGLLLCLVLWRILKFKLGSQRRMLFQEPIVVSLQLFDLPGEMSCALLELHLKCAGTHQTYKRRKYLDAEGWHSYKFRFPLLQLSIGRSRKLRGLLERRFHLFVAPCHGDVTHEEPLGSFPHLLKQILIATTKEKCQKHHPPPAQPTSAQRTDPLSPTNVRPIFVVVSPRPPPPALRITE